MIVGDVQGGCAGVEKCREEHVSLPAPTMPFVSHPAPVCVRVAAAYGHNLISCVINGVRAALQRVMLGVGAQGPEWDGSNS